MTAAPITRERVRAFEMLQYPSTESLMRPVGAIEGNGQGYAYFEKGEVRAALSTNRYAAWTTSTYGLTREMDPATLEEVIGFFESYGVAARVRVVPDGFTMEKASLLAKHRLRHYGFHTVMWSPLPLPTDSPPPPAKIRIVHVTDPAEFEVALDVQLEAWGVPYNPDSPIKKLRRCWRTIEKQRTYLAYVDGEPAGHAMLYVDGPLAYFQQAATIKRFRNRGVHSALIRRRIADAAKLGCDTIVGGADFESLSRVNQMRAGLQIGYLAALWQQDAPPSRGTTQQLVSS